METLLWYGYVFLGLIGLIALAIGGVLVVAVVDAIRISNIKYPSRFKRADRLKSFRRENLPAIAKSLKMETIEQAPRKLEVAIEATIGTLGSGGVSDLLSKSSGKGTLSLGNVQKNLSQSHRFQADNSMEWTKVEELTCLIFLGDNEIDFPCFNLTPNEHSLMIKLINQRMFGAVKYEDDPEFHRQILVGTTEPDRVRPLLTPRVREVLKQQADLRTAVSGPLISSSTITATLVKESACLIRELVMMNLSTAKSSRRKNGQISTERQSASSTHYARNIRDRRIEMSDCPALNERVNDEDLKHHFQKSECGPSQKLALWISGTIEEEVMLYPCGDANHNTRIHT